MANPLAFSADAGRETRNATIEAASAQTRKAEVVQGKEEDDLLILDYEPGAGRNPRR